MRDELRPGTPLGEAVAKERQRRILWDALASIMKNTCCEGCGEAARVARKAILDCVSTSYGD